LHKYVEIEGFWYIGFEELRQGERNRKTRWPHQYLGAKLK